MPDIITKKSLWVCVVEGYCRKAEDGKSWADFEDECLWWVCEDEASGESWEWVFEVWCETKV